MNQQEQWSKQLESDKSNTTNKISDLSERINMYEQNKA